MTVHSARPAASMPVMNARCANPFCPSPAITDVDHNGLCLECALRASGPLVAARQRRPRRTPQPLSLEAKLRQSLTLHRSPVIAEPFE